MTRPSSCHLLDMLAEVPAPRNKKGKRDPLKLVLTLVVVGLMCGYKRVYIYRNLGAVSTRHSQKHSVLHIRLHLVPQQYLIF